MASRWMPERSSSRRTAKLGEGPRKVGPGDLLAVDPEVVWHRATNVLLPGMRARPSGAAAQIVARLPHEGSGLPGWKNLRSVRGHMGSDWLLLPELVVHSPRAVARVAGPPRGEVATTLQLMVTMATLRRSLPKGSKSPRQQGAGGRGSGDVQPRGSDPWPADPHQDLRIGHRRKHGVEPVPGRHRHRSCGHVPGKAVYRCLCMGIAGPERNAPVSVAVAHRDQPLSIR
jgi:hypothetical protein